jgi:hypothetical protein
MHGKVGKFKQNCIRNLEGIRKLGRHRWIGSGQGPAADPCERSNSRSFTSRSARSQVLTAASMQFTASSDIAPCSISN